MATQIDIASIIDYLVPAADYEGSLTANNEAAYWGMVWKDERTKPTWQQILDAADGNITYVPGSNNSSLNLPQKREVAKEQVDTLRISTEKKGLPYSFNGVSDVVQLRDVEDFINILGIVNTAQILIGQGSVSTIPFRAQSNTTYELTPQQAIELGLAVSFFRQSLYQKAWQYKSDIDSCKTKVAVDAVLSGMNWSI